MFIDVDRIDPQRLDPELRADAIGVCKEILAALDALQALLPRLDTTQPQLRVVKGGRHA